MREYNTVLDFIPCEKCGDDFRVVKYEESGEGTNLHKPYPNRSKPTPVVTVSTKLCTRCILSKAGLKEWPESPTRKNVKRIKGTDNEQSGF